VRKIPFDIAAWRSLIIQEINLIHIDIIGDKRELSGEASGTRSAIRRDATMRAK
jgi:hypothetical protein